MFGRARNHGKKFPKYSQAFFSGIVKCLFNKYYVFCTRNVANWFVEFDTLPVQSSAKLTGLQVRRSALLTKPLLSSKWMKCSLNHFFILVCEELMSTLIKYLHLLTREWKFYFLWINKVHVHLHRIQVWNSLLDVNLSVWNPYDLWAIKLLLKSDSKFSALNRKVDVVSRPWVGFLSFRYRYEVLIECDLNLEVLWSKSLLSSNPKGLKKLTFSPKGPMAL